MGLKGLAKFVVWMAILSAPIALAALPDNAAGSNRQTPLVWVAFIAATQSPATPTPATPAPGTENEGVAHDLQPPHITAVNPPAPAPVGWTWQEEVAWGANILLAVVGLAGINLGYALLRKIERQTAYAETAADAAASSAQAALLSAQAFIHSERPWILITVEPSRSIENSFTVLATNRGRTPARIAASEDEVIIAIVETQLPIPPEYDSQKRSAPYTPIILLPGEFTAIKTFCREEVKGLCDSEERFKRIETWEEKLFLYGRVHYRDLISPSDSQEHETNWCCWYIHGRQNSGLVIAGPPEYNSHT